MKKSLRVFGIRIFLLTFLILNLNFSNKCICQWVQTDGIYGGSVYSIAVDGSNIFAGCYASVFLSSNSGQTWNRTSFSPHYYLSVISLAVNGQYVYAGLNYDSGLYRSTDYGQTWAKTSLYNQNINCIATIGSYVFAECNHPNGVYVSSDNGQNWQSTFSERSGLAFAVEGTNIFVGTNSYGVYLSTNYGQNWNQTGLHNHVIRSLTLSGSTIFAGTGEYPLDTGIYKSTNNGANWILTSLKTRYVNSLIINNSNVYAGCTEDSGFYMSSNNGTNWIKIALDYTNINALCSSGSNIFAGTDFYGIIKSSDNGQNCR